VSFKWNSTGTAVLVFSSCDVDKTNQSYYGETNLHFLRTDRSHEGNVPLSKEGPIHDFEWAPNGTSFVVVYGFMPAKATMFSDACKPTYEFGSGPWNMVRPSRLSLTHGSIAVTVVGPPASQAAPCSRTPSSARACCSRTPHSPSAREA
jgi:uncharacterized protein with WD repeat